MVALAGSSGSKVCFGWCIWNLNLGFFFFFKMEQALCSRCEPPTPNPACLCDCDSFPGGYAPLSSLGWVHYFSLHGWVHYSNLHAACSSMDFWGKIHRARFLEAPSWASSPRKKGSIPRTGMRWVGFNSNTLEKRRGYPQVCKWDARKLSN